MIVVKMCLAAALTAISLGGPVAPEPATSLNTLGQSFLLPPFIGSQYPGQLYETGDSPESIAIGDLDADSKQDLVVANALSNSVSVLRNMGHGVFDSKADYDTGSGPTGSAVGDLNGDGALDLVVTNHYGHSVSVLRNYGNGTFAPKLDFATGNWPGAVSIDDLDGDGKLDLVVSSANDGVTGKVRVLRNTTCGSGEISFSGIDYPTGNYTLSVATGDLDSDGGIDIVAAIYNPSGISSVSVLRNNGDGTFADRVTYAAGYGASAVSIGDLDGDGRADLAVANYNDKSAGSVSVLRNNGDGTFAPSTAFATGYGTVCVTIRDFNNDDRADLVVSNIDSNSVSVLRNTSIIGHLAFADKLDYPTGNYPVALAAGDLDGDQRPDLAFVNKIDDGVSVFRNIGDGLFSSRIDYAAGLSSGPGGVAVGDVNGDGWDDLVVTNYGFGNVSVHRNNGNGLLAPGLRYPTDRFVCSVAIGDLDEDGKADLALANCSSNSLSVLRNNGNGGFTGRTDYSTGLSPTSVAICDLNGDGKADLAVANATSNTVSILTNNGNGTFRAKVDFATGPVPSSLAICDLDGDGRADLAVANWSHAGAGSVSVLRNISAWGGLGFAARVDYDTGSGPESVAAGDLDGDGRADLAIANTYSSSVSVFRNTSVVGSLSFSEKRDHAAGGEPYSVAIDYLDGDDSADLAVAIRSRDTVSVFRDFSMDRGMTSAARVDYTTAGTAYSVAIGDLNGDGRADLAVASNDIFSNTVSVLLNQIPPAQCFADFNGDGLVNTPDLTFFLGRFGQPATPGSPAERADFNSDGVVNTADLTFFLGRFGQAC